MAINGPTRTPHEQVFIPPDPRMPEGKLLAIEMKALKTLFEALKSVQINGGTTADFKGNHELEAAIELCSMISFDIITDVNREFYFWDTLAKIECTLNAIQMRLEEIKERLEAIKT